eukprot:scaffold1295_cov65-Phaeocystis_antarctica.AAC.3
MASIHRYLGLEQPLMQLHTKRAPRSAPHKIAHAGHLASAASHEASIFAASSRYSNPASSGRVASSRSSAWLPRHLAATSAPAGKRYLPGLSHTPSMLYSRSATRASGHVGLGRSQTARRSPSRRAPGVSTRTNQPRLPVRAAWAPRQAGRGHLQPEEACVVWRISQWRRACVNDATVARGGRAATALGRAHHHQHVAHTQSRGGRIAGDVDVLRETGTLAAEAGRQRCLQCECRGGVEELRALHVRHHEQRAVLDGLWRHSPAKDFARRPLARGSEAELRDLKRFVLWRCLALPRGTSRAQTEVAPTHDHCDLTTVGGRVVHSALHGLCVARH